MGLLWILLDFTLLDKTHIHNSPQDNPFFGLGSESGCRGKTPLGFSEEFLSLLESWGTPKCFWRHKKGSYGHTLEMISTISQFLSWEPLVFDKTRNVKPFYLFLNQQVLALYISPKFCLKTEQFLFLTHLSLYIIICNSFKEPTGTLSILPANLLTKIYEFIRYFFIFHVTTSDNVAKRPVSTSEELPFL